MRTTRMLAGATTLAAAATFALASPASAAPQQSGLINVNVTDLDVQVPVAVAANICDVNVAVLVQDLVDDAATCTADGQSVGTVTRSPDGPGARQEGLVNVSLDDVAVQIPITVAANVCDVNVAVLTGLVLDDSTPCIADADGNAIITPA